MEPESEAAYQPPEGFLRRVYNSAPEALRRAWRVTMALFKGFRTLGAAAVVMLAGLADQYDLLDIIGWIRALMGESAKVGAVVFVTAGIFFCLRLASKRPHLSQAKGGVDEGE